MFSIGRSKKVDNLTPTPSPYPMEFQHHESRLWLDYNFNVGTATPAPHSHVLGGTSTSKLKVGRVCVGGQDDSSTGT